MNCFYVYSNFHLCNFKAYIGRDKLPSMGTGVNKRQEKIHGVGHTMQGCHLLPTELYYCFASEMPFDDYN